MNDIVANLFTQLINCWDIQLRKVYFFSDINCRKAENMNSLMEKAMKSENKMEELKKRINDFIQGRLEVKLTKLPPSDKKRQQIIEEYQPKNWISNAARRAWQIQLVTHAIKFQHPDAKGASK
uniref:Putative cytosolic protein n=1 Tax=Coxiella burnetii TaxID=777 RepID=L0BWB3_COXBE|nr:putative cytosolic protein [Coxiella burnetii]